MEEFLSRNEELYDDVDQQSHSDVIKEQSYSFLHEYHESSNAHIYLKK